MLSAAQGSEPASVNALYGFKDVPMSPSHDIDGFGGFICLLKRHHCLMHGDVTITILQMRCDDCKLERKPGDAGWIAVESAHQYNGGLPFLVYCPLCAEQFGPGDSVRPLDSMRT